MSLFNRIKCGKVSMPAQVSTARITAPVLAGLIATLAFFISPATAQIESVKDQQSGKSSNTQNLVIEGIDFGNNTSEWANDGECDDTRFVGIGTAVEMAEGEMGRDAQDCSELFLVGDVSLKPDPADIVNEIDFGSNTSDWANNDICDDPRFGGPGTDELLLDEDIGRDANDCKNLFLAGQVNYLGDDPNMEVINFDGILFGDNTSQWSNDEECDDPRFSGTGMASKLDDDNQEHDATDCLALYQVGSISVIENGATAAAIDFGDDSSRWSYDGECDDPRFIGSGVATLLDATDMGRDATDCKNLSDEGMIEFITAANVDFGDDSSRWANDGECDDLRFAGPGSATKLDARNFGRDAADCRTLLQSGQVDYLGGVLAIVDTTSLRYEPVVASTDVAPTDVAPTDVVPTNGSESGGIDFGDDSSRWANDGECDDPRFAGPGVPEYLDDENLGHDATDCSALFQQGQIQLVQGGDGQLTPDQPAVETAPPSSTGAAGELNFGDDSSTWANDGECDDPRFSGPGAASTLLDEDLGRDATDCSTLFQQGQIQLVQGDDGQLQTDLPAVETAPQPSTTTEGELNFGDDSGVWANDGECDDPRFAGPGTAASPLSPLNLLKDATDCQTLFENGEVELI